MATYHSGEIAVQERAGLAREAGYALGGIGATVPPVAREFLAEQPLIVLGGSDRAGRIWATQLTGPPGFIRVPDPRTVTIDALPLPEDPLADILATGSRPRIGMIAIEPATRRRMRVNGRAHREGDALHVDLDQVIANCPKYLQKRHYVETRPGDDTTVARTAVEGTELTPAQQRTVRAADTFFVATASDQGDADASHRGGNPGFVQVLSPTLLRWPDYTGNAMFLTLGNLLLNASAGLLVPDWETGTTLHLSGTAHTVWDPEEIARVPGAQRLVEFTVEAVREITGASPLRWSSPAYSRFNPPAG
ncbi:pyridoxamine 5'-phosphate oxidase family protein [Streptomyces sp. SID5910]|uniref:pyridoxamine 5'-phosphate oxidase family protein n=1 Tax=Streptomyces sp. SID5910 TaxID=2690312 RepID=UPI00136EBAB2|nr:pyridoxamine 5'-phosphate oxidase family protein [Streptomyces sp. SID5910]